MNSSAAGAMIQAVSGEGNKKPLSIDALYEIETSPAAGANPLDLELEKNQVRVLKC